jgi:hypothetical protein
MLGMAMQPFEVSYTTIGRKGKKERNVIGVICPTVLAQRLGLARPIFVSLGDVIVDWNAPTSDGYRAMFDAPNAKVSGAGTASAGLPGYTAFEKDTE